MHERFQVDPYKEQHSLSLEENDLKATVANEVQKTEGFFLRKESEDRTTTSGCDPHSFHQLQFGNDQSRLSLLIYQSPFYLDRNHRVTW